jgi:23S rRNA pseudouridine1911/1915/1917 synthase
MEPFAITADQAGSTLAAVLRSRLPGQSWSQVRRLIENRRARINSELCCDAARRVKEGETIELLAQPAPPPRQVESIVLRYVDGQVVVIEKPTGIATMRHPSERDWDRRRKELTPTLEDSVPKLLAHAEGRKPGALPRLRIVHRLDKGTSGLVVFARTALAERELGRQFHAHTVVRRYLALVPGSVSAQRIESWLVRDRGDGRRGSGHAQQEGKRAVTHVDVVEQLNGYALLDCRLETGRTHQIRIHLAELGHPVCGEKVYVLRRDGSVLPDHSGAPRLALHAAQLGFRHPSTQKEMHWTMPLPADLKTLLDRLRQRMPKNADRDSMDR